MNKSPNTRNAITECIEKHKKDFFLLTQDIGYRVIETAEKLDSPLTYCKKIEISMCSSIYKNVITLEGMMRGRAYYENNTLRDTLVGMLNSIDEKRLQKLVEKIRTPIRHKDVGSC